MTKRREGNFYLAPNTKPFLLDSLKTVHNPPSPSPPRFLKTIKGIYPTYGKNFFFKKNSMNVLLSLLFLTSVGGRFFFFIAKAATSFIIFLLFHNISILPDYFFYFPRERRNRYRLQFSSAPPPLPPPPSPLSLNLTYRGCWLLVAFIYKGSLALLGVCFPVLPYEGRKRYTYNPRKKILCPKRSFMRGLLIDPYIDLSSPPETGPLLRRGRFVYIIPHGEQKWVGNVYRYVMNTFINHCLN